MKYCEHYDREASQKHVDALLENRDATASAAQELFSRTLAFFCVLHDKGCAFEVENDGGDSDDLGSDSSDQGMDEPRRIFDRTKTCNGKIKICYSSRYQRPFLQCANFYVFLGKFLTVCFIGANTKKLTILCI